MNYVSDSGVVWHSFSKEDSGRIQMQCQRFSLHLLRAVHRDIIPLLSVSLFLNFRVYFAIIWFYLPCSAVYKYCLCCRFRLQSELSRVHSRYVGVV